MFLFPLLLIYVVIGVSAFVLYNKSYIKAKKKNIYYEQEIYSNLNYNDKMLYAFIDDKDKYNWYKKAFDKYNVNGINRIAWNWSWYAFFFGGLYLLYRKLYLEGLAYFLIMGMLFSGAKSSLILSILIGGLMPYVVYLKYKKKKEEIESKISNEEDRIKAINIIGGSNKRLFMNIIISLVIFISLVFSIFFIAENNSAVKTYRDLNTNKVVKITITKE